MGLQVLLLLPLHLCIYIGGLTCHVTAQHLTPTLPVAALPCLAMHSCSELCVARLTLTRLLLEQASSLGLPSPRRAAAMALLHLVAAVLLAGASTRQPVFRLLDSLAARLDFCCLLGSRLHAHLLKSKPSLTAVVRSYTGLQLLTSVPCRRCAGRHGAGSCACAVHDPCYHGQRDLPGQQHLDGVRA